ncbi:hypothetical protein FBU30_001507 [Linnemannia zychae]|nr:hypothetical protein FBU30_001507 [Linnemannia zychae]
MGTQQKKKDAQCTAQLPPSFKEKMNILPTSLWNPFKGLGNTTSNTNGNSALSGIVLARKLQEVANHEAQCDLDKAKECYEAALHKETGQASTSQGAERLAAIHFQYGNFLRKCGDKNNAEKNYQHASKYARDMDLEQPDAQELFKQIHDRYGSFIANDGHENLLILPRPSSGTPTRPDRARVNNPEFEAYLSNLPPCVSPFFTQPLQLKSTAYVLPESDDAIKNTHYLAWCVQNTQASQDKERWMHDAYQVVEAFKREALNRFEDQTKYPELAWSIEYIRQALARLPNNESFSEKLIRRALPAVGGLTFLTTFGLKIASGESFISGFEPDKLWEAYRCFKEAFSEIEWLKQATWYSDLCFIDVLIGRGQLDVLGKFLEKNSEPRDEAYLRGVCDRLERIACLQNKASSRDEALKLLKGFKEGQITWAKQESIQQYARQSLDRIGLMWPVPDLAKMEKEGDAPAAWHPFWTAVPQDMLLSAVHVKVQQEAKQEAALYQITAIHNRLLPSQVSLTTLRNAFHRYYDASDLSIQRVSGEKASLDNCYINLAIVENQAQREKDRENLKALAFERLPSGERIEETNPNRLIELEKLFDKQKLRDGSEGVPKRILIHGRAGIGKTTLCKKLVYEYHHNGLWQDQFDCMVHVLITSRPSGVSASQCNGLDLELETIGFNVNNVRTYIEKYVPESNQGAIQQFINRTPLIQGLVNIPIQLDALCYSWDSLPKDREVTMTKLYQAMVDKLWRKDSVNLEKKEDGRLLSLLEIEDLSESELEEVMAAEIDYLSYLAFKGLEAERIEFSREELKQQRAPRDLIGVRHQQVLMGCVNEAKVHLKETTLGQFEEEWMHWLDVELNNSIWPYYDNYSRLGRQNTFPEPLLVKSLCRPEAEKMGIIETLGMRQSMLSLDAVLALITAFKDEDAYVRSSAAKALWFQSTLSVDAVLALISVLKDENEEVRSSAASVLCIQSKLSQDAVLALISALKDENASVRSRAAKALGSQSTLSLDPVLALISALKDEDASVRSRAAKALGRQSTLSLDAILALISALKDENASVRSRAALALGSQSTLSLNAVMALISALKDENKKVRFSAAEALCSQSTLSQDPVMALISAFKDENEQVRSSAAKALCRQSTLSLDVVLALISALKDENMHVRYSAAKALGSQSTLSPDAVLALISALKDEYASVRSSAAKALGSQSTLSLDPVLALISALKDEDAYVRSSAAEALCSQSTLSQDPVLALISALKDEDASDEDASVRSSAAKALGSQSTLSLDAVMALISAFKDENEQVRSSAAKALGSQSTLSLDAVLALISVLKDEYASVRYSAAEALVAHLDHYYSMLPSLSPEQIEVLYPQVLFRRSCERIAALYIQEHHLHFYTATGPGHPIKLSQEQKQHLMKTFTEVQVKLRAKARSAFLLEE